MTSRPLPEVSEGEAAGSVAETYAEIRATLGVPVVNLIYRHLADEPGRLELTWSLLRPNLADPRTHALALELARVAGQVRPRVSPPVHARRLAAAEQAAARATLAVYERANSLNLLAVTALLAGSAGSGGAARAGLSADPLAGDILPLADPASLDAPTRELLERLSAGAVRPGGDVLIPSLYRHLASSPALLRVVWDAAGAALAEATSERTTDAVCAEAARLAARLPHRVDAVADAGVRAVLERFAPAMAGMLVAGRTIAAALPGPVA